MPARLLAVLALVLSLAAASGAQEPGAGDDLLRQGRQWKARLEKLIAEHAAKESGGAPDPKACEACDLGMYQVDECSRVKVEDLKPEVPEVKTCGEDGAQECRIQTSKKPLALHCARRGADAACRAAVKDPAKLKALDKEARKLLTGCAACCTRRLDWERRRDTLAADLERLDLSLARKDLPAVAGAFARAETHQSCGWVCP